MPRTAIPLRLILIIPLLLCGSVARGSAQVAFEPPVPLAASATSDDQGKSDQTPVFASNGSGTWVVAWSSDDTLNGSLNKGDFDIFFARSTDGGLTFSAQAPIDPNAAHDISAFFGFTSPAFDFAPAIAAHGNRFLAAWQINSVQPNKIVVARSDDGGAHWAAPATLYEHSSQPTIATDGAGTWIIAWEFRPNPGVDADIYFTRSVDDGTTWSVPAALNTTASGDTLLDYNPRLFWSAGVWTAAWSASPNVVNSPYSEVFYARSVDGGATWSPPAPLNTNAAVDGAADYFPRLTSDGSGNWVAVWSSRLPGDDDEILVARSADGALTWTAPAVLNSDSGTEAKDDYGVDVTTGAGKYVVVWERVGTPSDPPSNHVDAMTASSDDGGVTWSAPTPLNPEGAAAAIPDQVDYQARVSFDPAGHFFAMWVSNDSSLASGTKGYDYDIVMALAGHSCGDGVVGAGEGCDDGDRGSLDCCGRTCAFDAPGVACAADPDPCTLERCDGAGACGHSNAPIGTPCAADTDLCTFDRCDGNDLCEHVFEPRTNCLVPTATRNSKLRIVSGPDPARHKLSWEWSRGPATVSSDFAKYTSGANYALCVYDGSGLIDRVDVPAGGTCGTKPCWGQSSKGDPRYLDRDGTQDGVNKVTSKSGKAGKTSIKIVGKGANLPFVLPFASTPVHAVLIDDEGLCFAATYATRVKKNSSSEFSAGSE